MNAFAALRASFVRAVDLDQSRLSLTTLPTFGTSWLTPRLGEFRAQASGDSARARCVRPTPGSQRRPLRRRHSQRPWALARPARRQTTAEHLHAAVLAEIAKSAAAALANPRRALDVPLLGRPTGGRCGFRARGLKGASRDKFGTSLCRTSISTSPQASRGTASPSARRILFRAELDAGRLVPAHDLVGERRPGVLVHLPGRAPGQPQDQAFRDWIADEAEREMSRARTYLRGAKIADGAELTAANRLLQAEGLVAG